MFKVFRHICSKYVNEYSDNPKVFYWRFCGGDLSATCTHQHQRLQNLYNLAFLRRTHFLKLVQTFCSEFCSEFRKLFNVIFQWFPRLLTNFCCGALIWIGRSRLYTKNTDGFIGRNIVLSTLKSAPSTD